MHEWLIGCVGCPGPEGIVALVAIDVAVSTVDARMSGNPSRVQELPDARLKEVNRRHRRRRVASAAKSVATARSSRASVDLGVCLAGLVGRTPPIALNSSAPITFVAPG